MKFAALLISTLLACTQAEPPRSSYLPPQARNNFGSNQFGGSSPSSQYGAPSFSSPRTNYGAPSQNSGRTNYAPPQSQYGAPSQQQQQPNSQYGAPAQQPNSQYGPPAQQSYDLPIEQDFGNNFQQSALSPQYGVPSSGSSRNGYSDSYSQGPANGGYEEPAKYEFQYDVQDEAAGLDFGHKEKRDGSVATGKYYVLLPDGRKQIVNYIADENGYRPTITYEETGRGGYDNNAQQQGYDNNAQGGFRGY